MNALSKLIVLFAVASFACGEAAPDRPSLPTPQPNTRADAGIADVGSIDMPVADAGTVAAVVMDAGVAAVMDAGMTDPVDTRPRYFWEVSGGTLIPDNMFCLSGSDNVILYASIDLEPGTASLTLTLPSPPTSGTFAIGSADGELFGYTNVTSGETSLSHYFREGSATVIRDGLNLHVTIDDVVAWRLEGTETLTTEVAARLNCELPASTP